MSHTKFNFKSASKYKSPSFKHATTKPFNSSSTTTNTLTNHRIKKPIAKKNSSNITVSTFLERPKPASIRKIVKESKKKSWKAEKLEDNLFAAAAGTLKLIPISGKSWSDAKIEEVKPVAKPVAKPFVKSPVKPRAKTWWLN
jgi:hypothetical protein